MFVYAPMSIGWTSINAAATCRAIPGHRKSSGVVLQTIEDLRHFIALRANLLQFTAPRSIRVVDPDQELQDLFEEIIGESARKTPRMSLRRLVGQRLFAAGVEDKIAQDREIKVPILQKTVEFPYGYQNGRFNLINPVRFAAKDADQSVATACKYAVEGTRNL
jgi:hypothetical protein